MQPEEAKGNANESTNTTVFGAEDNTADRSSNKSAEEIISGTSYEILNGTRNHNTNGNTNYNTNGNTNCNTNAQQDSYTNANNKSSDSQNQKQKDENENIQEFGQLTLQDNQQKYRIHLLTIIGEVEGHDCLPNTTKTTKYEHILPKLAAIEDSDEVDGVLILLNTVGGDVESGLAIAEMIASLSKPTVSLVLGGSHSIGIPLAVAVDYSFIVPTGTMVIHPVRMSGMVIGARQTFDYFKQMQDRIIGFIESHCSADKSRLEQMMMNTGMLTKDLGTILVGEGAVEEGIINEVGGISQAMNKLYSMIDEGREKK